ncbi:MAG: hypothetical protein FIB08_14445 [Candidatus Methanoperedens sp.]|nr:hypothetical protein [Candidatus Methanoperedens sp.]
MPIIKYKVNKKTWEKEIRPYFLEKRGVLNIGKALKDFNIPPEQIKEIKEKIIKKRKQKKTKIPSSFGEIYTSFFLEKKEKIYLIGLRWPREMFEIQTGMDLVGIKSEGFDIIYAQVKATEKEEKFLINKQKEGLPEDLKDKKIDEYFREGTKEPATKLWIIDLAKNLVERGIIKANKDTVEKLIMGKEKYIRYGSLVHPPVDYKIDFSPEFEKLIEYCKEKHENEGINCTKKCSIACSDRNPVYFVDMVVKDITQRVNDIIKLELIVVPKHGKVE